jgi:hypothetical protein
MNGLLLDHAFHDLTIIFNKKSLFLDLLKRFLTEPCEVGKRLGGEHHTEQIRYLKQLTALMLAEGRNISPHITSGPISYDLDIEGYKNQNNAAARWLEDMEKNHASEKKVKENREQGPDPEVHVDQQDTVDPQDEPNDEKNDIEGRPIELDPTAKFGDNSREDQLVTIIYEQLADRWSSPDLGPKILSRAQVTAHSVDESLVMLHVWLIKRQLDRQIELAGTDRQERLLQRYQWQQPPTLFWLFLKQFRHLLWKTEKRKRGDDSSEE